MFRFHRFKPRKPFPNWKNARYTSPKDPGYNCMAWVFGDKSQLWWPNVSGHYWPVKAKRKDALAELRRYLKAEGWRQDKSEKISFPAIAIYAKNSKLKHVARMLENGRWTSKLGEIEDIEHDLSDLVCDDYGSVVAIYVKDVLFEEDDMI